MRLPLANWQPDQEGLSNGEQDIKNVYPSGGNGYLPVKAPLELSTTGMIGQALGAISGQDTTGIAASFSGDGARLYQFTNGVFTDVSKVGGYSVGATERWEFAQFNSRFIATEISDPVQYYDVGSSSIFADLPDSPPQAKHIAVIRDFVVLGNTSNSISEVFWCGFNNSDQWAKGTNQCDAQTLQDGGPVQRIFGGEVGYIFQERGITRMTYVGTPLIFQFDEVEQARGLLTPGAACKVGNVIFYRSKDGFYTFDPYNGSTPIGHLKVDRWFDAHVQSDTLHLITASADPKRKIVAFSFVSTDATDITRPDTMLFYHWASKEWSLAKIDHDMVFPALTQGYTLEQIGALYATLEDVPVSLDSDQWAGGAGVFAVFTTDHQLATLTGDNLEALVETSDFEPIQGKRSLITNARPLSDTSAATITIRSRERFADTMINTNISTMMNNGDCPLLSEGRYHRAQIQIPAATDWSFATGIEVEPQDAGEI